MEPLHVPPFLERPTGTWYMDVLPILTLIPCLPTLYIYWRTRRSADFLVFSIGFLLAFVYHVCQTDTNGLAESKFLGISGAIWRTWDIVSACVLLVRTFGHALGSKHTFTRALPNVIFPASVLAMLHQFNSMDDIMPMALGTLLGTFLVKMMMEGSKTFPDYDTHSRWRIPLWFLLGFVCFFLPNLMPRMYWFWHSMWHIFLGMAYYELYRNLEKEKLCTMGDEDSCKGN